MDRVQNRGDPKPVFSLYGKSSVYDFQFWDNVETKMYFTEWGNLI
jgi:hypothetical protein